jgi:hypothetical protein
MTTEVRPIKCSYCKATPPAGRGPSEVAFFEDRGPDSRYATDTCGNCRYAEAAHADEVRTRPHLAGRVCVEFTPAGPAEYDLFYCGCHGWD